MRGAGRRAASREAASLSALRAFVCRVCGFGLGAVSHGLEYHDIRYPAKGIRAVAGIGGPLLHGQVEGIYMMLFLTLRVLAPI